MIQMRGKNYKIVKFWVLALAFKIFLAFFNFFEVFDA